MRGKTADKYGRGSAAANGAGFVDLAPGDTFDGLERQLRARIAEVYVNRTLGISASIGSKRNANELAKHMVPGESEEVHKFAAKNIGALFSKGLLGIRHLDKKAAPGQRWVIRFIRVFAPFVFAEKRMLATITLKENETRGNFYSVEAVDITKDAWSERTPRGAIPEGLNAAPLLDLAPLMGGIIAYYVGDCNRTRPEFVNRSEPFSVAYAVELLTDTLRTRYSAQGASPVLSTMHKALFFLDFSGTAVITDGGCSVTYAELKGLTESWHPEIAPRSLVFLLVHNNLDSLVAYVACLNRGIVPLMLDAKIDAELLARFEEGFHPNYVINCVDLSIRSACSTRLNLFPELALLITTSGSTGAPKLVRQSYRNIQANAESIAEYLKIDATERPITTLPMNYVYGLSIINSHLIRGATLLLTDKTLMQREFWNFFNEQNATSFGGVPYTYEMLDKLLFFRRKLPSLRTMTQAGGKILPALHRKFAEYAQREGKNFVVMYGASEATSRMSYLPPERSLDKIGSMGIPIPGGKFTLIGDNGDVIAGVPSAECGVLSAECGVPSAECHEVAQSTKHQALSTTPSAKHQALSTTFSPVGELVYYGPNVTLGYAECAADLAKGDERHGRLVTGDMAKRDADGYYYIVGRKKRFLKIFGNRVNLDETERLIKGHFTSFDCACGGKDDQMKIFITDPTQAKTVQDFIAEKTHLNFTAFSVTSINKIPKNESGKTLYKELPE